MPSSVDVILEAAVKKSDSSEWVETSYKWYEVNEDGSVTMVAEGIDKMVYKFKLVYPGRTKYYYVEVTLKLGSKEETITSKNKTE